MSSVDRSTIDQLKKLMKQKYILALDDYLRSSEDYIKKIQTSISHGDGKQIGLLVHSLKSSSRQVGAMKLGDLAEKIEKLAKESDIDGIKDLFDKAKAEYKKVREVLHDEMKTAAVRKKCLVIDDNRLHRAVAAEIVIELGFDSAETESAIDAISFVESGYVDFVLVDWHLPAMDGIEFIRTLRKDNNKIPIFLYSNIEDKQGTKNALEAGATGFIPKPVTKDKVEIELKKYGFL